MSDPLQNASNCATPQPQERQEDNPQSSAAMSGKHVTAENQDKHLATASTGTQPDQVRAARVVRPVHTEIGTELSSQNNPFAGHCFPARPRNDTDKRTSINSVSFENVEPDTVRLQIKILKNAITIVEKKIHEALQHPHCNPGKLFDSIQDCYLKSWCLQKLFLRWENLPPDIKTEQINQLISDFQNRFVHFLVLCQPTSQDQRQDLLFMCLWYLHCGELREEKLSANFLHICRKSASLFLVAPFDSLDQAIAKKRIYGPLRNDPSYKSDNLPRLLFYHLTQMALPSSAYNNQSDRIIANIMQQLQTDPLFQGDGKESHSTPVLLLVENKTGKPATTNTVKESLQPATDDQFSPARYVIRNIGICPFQTSSPAAALTVLEQLYRNRQLSDVREDIANQNATYAQSVNPYHLTVYALFQFLADYNIDASILDIIHDDLKLYLKALTHYLQAQRPQAEKLAAASQWAEASWLLGHLCHRRGDLGGAIANIQKAVDLGVASAALQLANLLLKSPSPDPKRVDDLIAEAVNYHKLNDSEMLAMRICHFGAQLQLTRQWQGDELFDTPPSTSKKKSKGKSRNKKKGPIQPPAPQHLTRSQLAQVNLLCIEAMNSVDYDRALQLLVDASQKVSWDFQRASLAVMDLWRLSEMNCDTDYLNLQHTLAANGSQTICVLRQDSELIRIHGLSPQKDDNISLTDDVTAIRENLTNWIINKSLGWMCLLHDTPGAEEQWRQTPAALARRQLEKFEHSPCLTFITALLLATTASVYEDQSSYCQNPDKAIQTRIRSSQFFRAASEFQNWQNRLNSDGRLKTRIEAASPLGGPQKHPKTSGSQRLDLQDRSAEKPEQQSRSDQKYTSNTVEGVVVDMVNHTTGDAQNEDDRAERPERDSNTTVV